MRTVIQTVDCFGLIAVIGLLISGSLVLEGIDYNNNNIAKTKEYIICIAPAFFFGGGLVSTTSDVGNVMSSRFLHRHSAYVVASVIASPSLHAGKIVSNPVFSVFFLLKRRIRYRWTHRRYGSSFAISWLHIY